MYIRSLSPVLVGIPEINGRSGHRNIHKLRVPVVQQPVNVLVRKPNHVSRRELLFRVVRQQQLSRSLNGIPYLLRGFVRVSRLAPFSRWTSVIVTLSLAEFPGFKSCLDTTPGFDSSLMLPFSINSISAILRKPLYLRESRFQIRDNILNILQTYREPYQSAVNARRYKLLVGELSVGSARGVKHAGADIRNVYDRP